LKYTCTNIGSAYNVAVSCGNGVGGTGFAIATHTDGDIRFVINATVVNNNSLSNVGEWYHVVGLRTAGTAYLYINNAAIHNLSSGNVGNTITNTTGFTIGKSAATDNKNYNDAVDDVRFYNRALSTAEIAKNYRHGTAKHKPLGS